MDNDPADDSLVALLITALDGAETDPVRLHLMVALALCGSPVISQADRDRLRHDGPPQVFRL